MKKRDPEKLYPHDFLMKPIVALVPDFLTPNHFTILRIFLTLPVLLLLFWQKYSWGVPLFLFAAFTDTIDGSLARWRKQVTDWGAFYDPVADKILIGSVLLLILFRYINPYIAWAVIFLEIMMIIGGWYHRRRGDVVHANVWGKIKMLLQFFGILFLLLAVWAGLDLFVDISEGTLVLAVVFAIIALLTYSL